MGVVQVILRPETIMESYAHELIFWFIPRHSIKTYMGCSENDGVCMKVMSRSTWNRSLLVRRESIQLISIRWWFRESLIKVEILEMVSNIDISESSLVDWARNEYIIGIDKFPYPYVYSGCQMIERLNCTVTLYWRVVLVFHQKFHIFQVGMIRC